eukprot:6173641-Pleurochrysis_carterae.AAC.1
MSPDALPGSKTTRRRAIEPVPCVFREASRSVVFAVSTALCSFSSVASVIASAVAVSSPWPAMPSARLRTRAAAFRRDGVLRHVVNF